MDHPVLAGRYRLERLIGAGSFSEVWLAYDLEAAERVAIKVGRQFLAGSPELEAGLADLVHEATILQRLDHPAIVRIRETGSDAGRLFVVMDYLDGPSLRALLADGPLDEAFATDIARLVASALGAVHAAGIVHNDVKPENIILVNGQPFLADFGVARDLRATLLPHQANQLAGTLAYIAPEVLEGQQPGPASDLYALAVTLYEAVSGRTPFAGTTALRAAAGLDRQPVPLAHVAPGASLHLDRFLARALAAIPAQRFQTAADFHRALPGSAQPTVRFAREGGTGRAPAMPAGRGAAVLPKVVAVLGVGAILFGGAMLFANGVFSGDGTPGDEDAAATLPTPTSTPPPPQPSPTATATLIPEPDPTELVEEPAGNPIDEFFTDVIGGLGTAAGDLGDFLGDLGDAAGGLRDRFGN